MTVTMNVNRTTVLFYVLLVNWGIVQIIGLPSFFPEWLIDGISLTSTALLPVAVALLAIDRFSQYALPNKGYRLLGVDVSNWSSTILKHTYSILLVVAFLVFATGAMLSPSTFDDSVMHVTIADDSELNTSTIPLNAEVIPQQTPDDMAVVITPRPPVDIDENTVATPSKVELITPPLLDRAHTESIADVPIAPKQTPRTPYELIEMMRTKTRRDAMAHKGYLIHVEGSVKDISEVQEGPSSYMPNNFIVIRVAVGSSRYTDSDYVKLYVDAEQWKQQVDTIERGDWVVATGVVDYIGKYFVDVLKGEIISVSGPDGNKR